MTAAYAPSLIACKTIWDANWTPVSGVPVIWHQNTGDAIPSNPPGKHWLHLGVEHSRDQAVAFGGGRGANERELHGSVVVRVMAQRGLGEVTALSLLDLALEVYRSRREGPLSFVGTSVLQQPGGSADGMWWVRSGIAVFTYRFRG